MKRHPIKPNRLILAAVLFVAGCTMRGGETTFTEPGLYECRARNPGFEDLPVYTIDSETADASSRIGIGAPSSVTMTTVEGERITFTEDAPPGYYCVKLASASKPSDGEVVLTRIDEGEG